MLTIKFETYQDVASFVSLFGKEALVKFHKSPMFCREQKQIVRDAIKASNDTTILLSEFNDGNVSYEEVLDLDFDSPHETKYIRTGFGACNLPIAEYLDGLKIYPESKKEIANLVIGRMNDIRTLSSLRDIRL